MGLYKRFILRGILAGAIIAAVISVGAILLQTRQTSATSVFDCNDNAVLYCGAQDANNTANVNALVAKYDNSGIPGHQHSDTHAIYNFFGISSVDIHSLASKVVIGQVHKDGTVWLNGKQIGSGALTAGRTDFAGSTPIPGTSAFMRPPSISFAGNSLDAYIGFNKGGGAAFAVLISCGNPVKFNHPNIELTKQVQNPSTHAYGKDANFNNGDHINYLLTVTNNGQATANNVRVADFLPAGQTYVKGSTKVNGHPVADGVVSFNTIDIGSLGVNAKDQVTFTATANLPATKCGVTAMTNTGVAGADNSNNATDTAGSHVNVTCVAECTNLTAPSYDVEVGQKLNFTATAAFKGVTVKSYTFKVDGKVVQVSDKNTYIFTSNSAGDHSVGVIVTFSNNTEAGDKGDCLKQVTVKPLPPVVSCDLLTADKVLVQPNEQIVFTAKGTATNGANISSYIFKVNGNVVQNTNQSTFNFSESNDGPYTVSVTIHPDQGPDVTSDTCVQTVHVQTVPMPITSCDLLTVTPDSIDVGSSVTATTKFTALNGATFQQATYTFDQANQTDQVISTQLDQNGAVVATHTYNQVGNFTVSVSIDFLVNGQKVTATNSQTCAKPVTVGAVLPATTPPAPTPPAQLINTGPGDVAGIFTGTSLAGAFIHRRWTIRRSNK